MRKIAVITASRADWGIYLPVIDMLKKRGIDFIIVAVGTDKSYLTSPCEGIDYVPYVGVCIVLGDTMPMLRATIEAVENNIPVFHIHGGDKTGSIDDRIRPAISCLSDFHFPSLPSHTERLVRMGIPDNKIRVVGPLGIYAMKDTQFLPENDLRQQLGLSDKPILIVIQHPVHEEADQAGEQMEQTLEAIACFKNYEQVIIYPNNESGSEQMIHLIETTPYNKFKNLPYLTFVSLLKCASVIVGNSSCGLVEAPLFGVPCVNIGTRQGERNRGLSLNVGYDSSQIREAITHFLSKDKWTTLNPYNLGVDGPAIIADTLAEVIMRLE